MVSVSLIQQEKIIMTTPAPAFEPKVIKRVTQLLLKPLLDEPVYVKFLEPIFTGKKVEADKDPAKLANIINLVDGSECQIIISAVVQANMEDEYPDSGYVSKCFSLTKHKKASGKSYNPYTILEIEDPAT